MKKKVIAICIITALLLGNLAVIASSLQFNSTPYKKKNVLKILEIGVDEGDKKLAYLFGDKKVMSSVNSISSKDYEKSNQINLDYEALLKNPDDLKKYASLVSNFEIIGDDVEIPYTTDIPEGTPEEKIYKQRGYLEQTSDDDYDYISKYFYIDDLESTDVYYNNDVVGKISDFDFNEIYRKDSDKDIYQKSDDGKYVKIGDYYYDIEFSDCVLYKTSDFDEKYELDTITPDDYVYMTLFGHLAYEGLWKDLDRYILSDLYKEDPDGDFICLENTGFDRLDNYIIYSADSFDKSNLEGLDKSTDILLYDKNNKLVYDGSLDKENLINKVGDEDFIIILGNKYYNIDDLKCYYLGFNVDGAENIVLRNKNSSEIVYNGLKTDLKLYKEDLEKVYKKDKNGSYIKYNNIYFDMKDLVCKFDDLTLSLSLYEPDKDGVVGYSYFRYITDIFEKGADLDYSDKPLLYNKWKFIPAFSGRLYFFSSELFEYTLKDEIHTDKYEIWESLSDTFGIENGETRIKYERDVTDSEEIDFEKSNVSVSLKDMIHKTDKEDNFAWISDNDTEVYYSFYTIENLNNNYTVLESKHNWDIIYIDVKNQELNDLYKKYTKNKFNSNSNNVELSSAVCGGILGSLGSSIVCFDGDFANDITFSKRLSSKESLYAKSIMMYPSILRRLSLDRIVYNTKLCDMISGLGSVIDGDLSELTSFAIDNLDLNPIAEHKVMSLNSGESICGLPIIEKSNTTKEVYAYSGVDSITARDCVGIMLNTKPKPLLTKSEYRVLEIEPCRSFLGGVNYKNEDSIPPYDNDNLYNWQMRLYGIDPYYTGKVSVDRMSISEFICSNKNIYDNYDIVYIGSKHDILSHDDYLYKDKDGNAVNSTRKLAINPYWGESFIPFSEFGLNEPIKTFGLLKDEHYDSEYIYMDNDGNYYYSNDVIGKENCYKFTSKNGGSIDKSVIYSKPTGLSRVKFDYTSSGILFIDYGTDKGMNILSNREHIFTGLNGKDVSKKAPFALRDFTFYINNRSYKLNADFSSYWSNSYLSMNDYININMCTYDYSGDDLKSDVSKRSELEVEFSCDSDCVSITKSGESLIVKNLGTLKETSDIFIKYKSKLPLLKDRNGNIEITIRNESGELSVINKEKGYSFDSNTKLLKDKDGNIIGTVEKMYSVKEGIIPIKVYVDDRNIVNSENKISTTYNDASMNGKLYTHLGDKIESSIGHKSEFDYRGVTSIQETINGVSYKENVFNRFSGSDLTKSKYEELKYFSDNGKLLLLSDKFYKGDTLCTDYFDKYSNMYKLVTTANIYKIGDIDDSKLNALDAADFSLDVIDEPIRYRDVSEERKIKWGVYLPDDTGKLDQFDLWYSERWKPQVLDLDTGKVVSVAVVDKIYIPSGCKKLRLNSDTDKYNFTLLFRKSNNDKTSNGTSDLDITNLYSASNEHGRDIVVPSDASYFLFSVTVKNPDKSPGSKVADWVEDFKKNNISLCDASNVKIGVNFTNFKESNFVSYDRLGILNTPSSLEEKQELFYADATDFNIRFKIKCNGNKRFNLKMFIDDTTDGKFNSDEELKDFSIESANGRAVDRTSLLPNTEYVLRVKLESGVCGLIHYMMAIYDNDNDKCFSSHDNYIAIKNDIVKSSKVINILQIVPNKFSIWEGRDKVTFKLYDDDGFKNYCKSITDFNLVVMGAMDGDESVRVEEFNGMQIPSITGKDYNDIAISKEWCERYYDNFGLTYTGEDGLSISDFDMIVIGFADDSVYITDEKLLNSIIQFKDSGKSMLMTHDVISHWYNINNSNQSSKSSIISKYFRDSVGQDRFGATYQSEDFNYTKVINNDPHYALLGNFTSNLTRGSAESFSEIIQQTNHDYCSNTGGYSFEGIEGIADPYIFRGRKTDIGQKMVFSDSVYEGNSDDSNLCYSNKIDVNNYGQINNYPFHIPDSIDISSTHFQYTQLNLDNDDLTVWYSLSSKDNENENNYKTVEFSKATGLDGRNNYYIYTKGNVTYSGVGHETVNKDYEKKLFVNTLVMAYRPNAKVPSVYLSNDNAEILETSSYLYLDSDYVDTSKILDSNYIADSNDIILEFEISDKSIVSTRNNYAQLLVLDKSGNEVAVPVEFYSKLSETGVSESDKLVSVGSEIVDDIKSKVSYSGIDSGIYNIKDMSKFYVKVNINDLLSCYSNDIEEELNDINKSSFTIPLKCWLYTSYDSKINKKWVSSESDIQIIKRDLFNIK